jgi:hypothetical protein
MTTIQPLVSQLVQQYLANHPECATRLRSEDWRASFTEIRNHVLRVYPRDGSWRDWETHRKPQVMYAVMRVCEQERGK